MWKRFWNREGAGKPAPRSGIKGYFYLIYTYYWQMLFLNFCFLLACLPVVTIPIALTAMDRVYIKLSQKGVVLFWAEFWHECKVSWKKSLPVGILYGILLGVCYYLLSLSASSGMNLWGLVTGVVGLVIFIFTIIIGAYTFILIAVQELPVKQLVKNAGCLAGICPKQSVIILLLVVGFFAIAFIDPIIFLVVLLLGGFSILQYSICWIVLSPLLQYILKREDMEEGTAAE